MMQHTHTIVPSSTQRLGSTHLSPNDRFAAALRFARPLCVATLLCCLVACGGSNLKHTIDDEALRTLTGEPAAKVAAARGLQQKREGMLLATRQERDGAQKQLKATEARKAEAA